MHFLLSLVKTFHMSDTEVQFVEYTELVDIQGCEELKIDNAGAQYVVNTINQPKVIYNDEDGKRNVMKFKRNCTITVTNRRIFYTPDATEIQFA